MKNLLDKESIFCYDAAGNSVSQNEYVKNLEKINDDIDKGTAQLFTTKEVRKRIERENSMTY